LRRVNGGFLALSEPSGHDLLKVAMNTNAALTRRRILWTGLALATPLFGCDVVLDEVPRASAQASIVNTRRHRVFVTTDAGGSDKDDMQSLIHLLLYSDQLDIVGLGSSAAMLGSGRVSAIHSVIAAYEADYANLLSHSAGYPTAAFLRSIVHEGSAVRQPGAGVSTPTSSSRAIVAAAKAASPESPLYLLTWGSHGDVAQALHDDPTIAPNIRLISSGVDGQDPNAHRYLLAQWRGRIWWINSATSGRGIYAPPSGANTPDRTWPGPNAGGHGKLGDLFIASSQDLYGEFDGAQRVDGLKMGDTFSVLYLIDPGRNPDNPAGRGWGGSYAASGPRYWTDSRDRALAFGNYRGAKTVADHKSVFLADFAARFDRALAAKAVTAAAHFHDH
jgi:hypothetical protein